MSKFIEMEVFVTVVQAGSFVKAAEVLNVSKATISRQVAQLETRLGVRLLHRTTRKVELTEAGAIYFERCKRIIDEARLAHEQLDNILAQPSGVLRASLPVDLAVSYLAPLLVEFAERYPDIRFDFDLTPRQVDLVSEPFDIAVRVGEPEDSQLIARPLARLATGLYASPGYLQAAGVPQHPAELERHTCLGILKTASWQLHSAASTVDLALKPVRFMLNSIGMLRKLASLDQGIILMPESMVADELEHGALCRILPEWHGNPVPVHAVTETRLLPAKTQVFIDFLRERLADRIINVAV